MADYTPLAAKTRYLPPSPARDLAEWRILAGNGGLHAIARQNMPIAAIVRPCPPKHTNNRRFHVLVQQISCLHASKAILQLGGNDLTRLNCRPVQLAKDIINSARQLVQVEGFSHVTICQLCYRYPSSTSACRSMLVRRPLRPMYNVLVDEVNAELRRLLSFFSRNYIS